MRKERRVARGSTRCPTSSRRPISRLSSAALKQAQRDDRGIVWGLGAHVIKTGLSPVLIDLMERGYVSAIATNGAGVIHDFELALSGATSEEVDEALGPGRFGMADETGRQLNAAINEGVGRGLGIGQAVGAWLRRAAPPHARSQPARRCRSSRHSGHRARRDRHRHHPHASRCVRRGARRGQPARLPLLRLERRAPRGGRVPELRIRRRAARSVPEGCRARPQPRCPRSTV